MYAICMMAMGTIENRTAREDREQGGGEKRRW